MGVDTKSVLAIRKRTLYAFCRPPRRRQFECTLWGTFPQLKQKRHPGASQFDGLTHRDFCAETQQAVLRFTVDEHFAKRNAGKIAEDGNPPNRFVEFVVRFSSNSGFD